MSSPIVQSPSPGSPPSTPSSDSPVAKIARVISATASPVIDRVIGAQETSLGVMRRIGDAVRSWGSSPTRVVAPPTVTETPTDARPSTAVIGTEARAAIPAGIIRNLFADGPNDVEEEEVRMMEEAAAVVPENLISLSVDHTYDPSRFAEFADQKSSWPPALQIAVDALISMHKFIINAARDDLQLGLLVSSEFREPWFSSQAKGTIGGHFPPSNTVGDTTIFSLRKASSGLDKGCLIPSNPCQQLFNWLLTAATREGGARDQTQTPRKTRYVTENGDVYDVELAPEACWLLSNDFVDLYPVLENSRYGKAIVRETVKKLGREFVFALQNTFVQVLIERARYNAARRGSPGVASTIALWGVSTSDGVKFSGVMSDISTLLSAMNVNHARFRHPEAILRRSSAALMSAKFDDAELDTFLTSMRLEGFTRSDAIRKFLAVQDMTDADREKIREIMRSIGRAVWRKPGIPGSAKYRLFEWCESNTAIGRDVPSSEIEEKQRLISLAKLTQSLCCLLGILRKAKLIAENDPIDSQIATLRTTSLGQVLSKLQLDNVDEQASIFNLDLAFADDATNVQEESDRTVATSAKVSWLTVLDKVAIANYGMGYDHAKATFVGMARAAGISQIEAERMSWGEVQNRCLAVSAGLSAERAATMTTHDLLDAVAAKKHGGKSFAQLSLLGKLRLFGLDNQDAETILQANIIEDRYIHQLAYARNLGLDLRLHVSQLQYEMSISPDDFAALTSEERRALSVASQAFEMAEVLDFDDSDALRLHEETAYKSLSETDNLWKPFDIIHGNLQHQRENIPVIELLREHNDLKITPAILESLATHRCREAALLNKTTFKLTEIRQMSLQRFKSAFAALEWPCYSVDVEKYKQESRWIDDSDMRFEPLRVLIESDRRGLLRGLPNDWSARYAMVPREADHQVYNRLYKTDDGGETWHMAKLPSFERPATGHGPWKNAARYMYATSDSDKSQFIEREENLVPFEEVALPIIEPFATACEWNRRVTSLDQVKSWAQEGSWIGPADANFDLVDYMVNDARNERSQELPLDWESRVRFHRHRNMSAEDDTAMYYDLYIDRRITAAAEPLWYGVRNVRAPGADRSANATVPRYQLAFIKANLFQTPFVDRVLDEQTKICQGGFFTEEYILGVVLTPRDVQNLEIGKMWIRQDGRQHGGREKFTGFAKISKHLATRGIPQDAWKASFAFGLQPRTDRVGGFRSVMYVMHRGKWRECNVRTRSKRLEDGSLMPKQNHKTTWQDRGEFVRLWLNSAH